jgi:hypothetical protein
MKSSGTNRLPKYHIQHDGNLEQNVVRTRHITITDENLFFFSNFCQLATLAICELCIFTNYDVVELTVVDGKRGSGWLTGSRPRRILLAL